MTSNFCFGSVRDPVPSGLSGYANPDLEFVFCNKVLLTLKSLHSCLELKLHAAATSTTAK